jgi:hypothetical protein
LDGNIVNGGGGDISNSFLWMILNIPVFTIAFFFSGDDTQQRLLRRRRESFQMSDSSQPIKGKRRGTTPLFINETLFSSLFTDSDINARMMLSMCVSLVGVTGDFKLFISSLTTTSCSFGITDYL